MRSATTKEKPDISETRITLEGLVAARLIGAGHRRSSGHCRRIGGIKTSSYDLIQNTRVATPFLRMNLRFSSRRLR
jgi:hypothetical protein